MAKRKKGTEELTPEAIEALNAITEETTEHAEAEGKEPEHGEPIKAKPKKRRRGRPSLEEINANPMQRIKASDFAAVLKRLDEMAKAIATAEAVIEKVEKDMRADPLLRIWIGQRTTSKARNLLKDAYKVVHGRKVHKERAAEIAKREVMTTSPFVKKPAQKKKPAKVQHNAHIFKRKTTK